jgi:hypothetical protein
MYVPDERSKQGPVKQDSPRGVCRVDSRAAAEKTQLALLCQGGYPKDERKSQRGHRYGAKDLKEHVRVDCYGAKIHFIDIYPGIRVRRPVRASGCEINRQW